MPTDFYVVEVNNDPSDRHAATTLEEAIDLANPDFGSTIRACIVQADDANIALRNFDKNRLIDSEFVEEAFHNHLVNKVEF